MIQDDYFGPLRCDCTSGPIAEGAKLFSPLRKRWEPHRENTEHRYMRHGYGVTVRKESTNWNRNYNHGIHPFAWQSIRRQDHRPAKLSRLITPVMLNIECLLRKSARDFLALEEGCPRVYRYKCRTLRDCARVCLALHFKPGKFLIRCLTENPKSHPHWYPSAVGATTG